MQKVKSTMKANGTLKPTKARYPERRAVKRGFLGRLKTIWLRTFSAELLAVITAALAILVVWSLIKAAG